MNSLHSSIAHLVASRQSSGAAHRDVKPHLPSGETTFGIVRAFKETPLLASADLPSRIRVALGDLRGGRRSERIRAARDLGEMAMASEQGIPDAVIPLTVTLTSDRDEMVRQEAAWALWKLRDARAVPALMTSLLDDVSASVREKAARSLGLMGAHEAVAVMLDLLTLDRHVASRVRAGMISAFGHLADPTLFDVVVKALQDAEPLVRYEGVRALGRFIGRFSEEMTAYALKLVCRSLKPGRESCALIRQAAVKVLRFHASEVTASAIATALIEDPESVVREAAAEALLFFDRRESEVALVQALEDDVWQVRKAASRTLSRFIIRHRVYNAPVVTEALRRMERMLPSHSLEWRLAAEAFASL